MGQAFTERQGQYLAFIHGYILKRGYAPSFEEIATHFGTTTPSVNGMIKTLERGGWLERQPGVPRSLRVLVPSTELPSSDFRTRTKKASRSRSSDGPGLSPEDVAATAAIAVLDGIRQYATGPDKSGDLRMTAVHAAAAVGKALKKLGVDQPTIEAVVKRVEAEAARWDPEGKGIVIRRQYWTFN